MLQIEFLSVSCEIALRCMPLNPIDDELTLDSGNGLEPSGSKPLPEAILTQIYVATQLH